MLRLSMIFYEPRQMANGPSNGNGSRQHEITIHRQFRPSTDPQWGDLLPLPPSDPASPNVEPVDELPGLPESRQNTPEAEFRSGEKHVSAIRKNLVETPMKSPSQSAVPLKFLIDNRSIPPVPSPATLSQDSFVFPGMKSQRPTFWNSSKEYKPLWLVESTRRRSNSQNEQEDPLAELAPSQTASRSSSELDLSKITKSSKHSRDLPSAPRQTSPVDELPSILRQPSPVDPMSKDRSSHLLQSFLMAGSFDDANSRSGIVDSPTPLPQISSSDPDALHGIQERKGSDIFEPPRALPQNIEQDHERTLRTFSSIPSYEELSTTTIDAEADPIDEFAFPNSKKDKKRRPQIEYGPHSPFINDLAEPEACKSDYGNISPHDK